MRVAVGVLYASVAVGVLYASILLGISSCRPAPGPVHMADEAEACSHGDPAATVWDSAAPVNWWLTGEETCPRGFTAAVVFSLRAADDAETQPETFHCVRNFRVIACGVSMHAAQQGAAADRQGPHSDPPR